MTAPTVTAPFIVMIGYGPAETVRVRTYKATDTGHALMDTTDFDHEGHVEAIDQHMTEHGIHLDRATRADLGGCTRYAAYPA